MLRPVSRRSGIGARLALAGAVALAALTGCTKTQTPADAPAAVTVQATAWSARVAATVDTTSLADMGVQIPDGANVLAARIFSGGDAPAYTFFEEGGGGFSHNFFPASSIKLLAALGALDFAHTLGLTGDALIDGEWSIRDTYDAALRWSSNEDYDELVRIAGVDRLNTDFLPSQGYTATAIQEPYGSDEQVTDSPEMVLSEDNQQVDVPERDGEGDYGCQGGNCSDLFDLVDALRRVMLDAELPRAERFDLSPSDIAGLQDDLAAAEGFIAPGVAEALGPDALVFTKPGWVPELDCVETSFVVDPNTGHRFLLGLSAPDDGTCDELSTMARDVLTALDRCDDGTAMRTDGTRVAVVDGRQSSTAVPATAPVTMGCQLR